MLNINCIEHVYLALGVTDLRKYIDGLVALAQESLNLDPFSSSLFVYKKRMYASTNLKS